MVCVGEDLDNLLKSVGLMNALSFVGRGYVASDEVYKGIETLEKVINAYPYNINSMVNLGVAYHKTGMKRKHLRPSSECWK